ncbi:hypothetical protein BGZ76_002021, partial [Entomortierella beljakovae]
LCLVKVEGFFECSESGGVLIARNSVFMSSFCNQIALLCPHLKKLHLSDRHSDFPTYGQLEEIVNLFPSVTNWEITPTMECSLSYSHLRSFNRNLITTLEISGERRLGNEALHYYLCEAPHLLRLTAPYISFSIAWFDLEGILYPKRLDIEHFNRRIWACRSLQSLHLKFDYSWECNNPLDTMSRLLFGYISKVCPRLQDFAVDCSILSLGHNGGLCLLARLHDLKKLRIVHRGWLGLNLAEFSWITKDVSPSLKIKILNWIAIYKKQEPARIFARTPFHITKNARPYEKEEQTLGSKGDHIIDEVDMKYIGRSLDIAACYQERLEKVLPCLPNLERISIDSAYFLNEVRKLRPAVELTRHE